MPSFKDYDDLTWKCCSLILQNPVQLIGLQKHCELFTPGKFWLIAGQYDTIVWALDKLEHRFKRGPATHLAIRKFFFQAQVKICILPADHAFIRRHPSVVAQYNAMDKKMNFIVLFQVTPFEPENTVHITASMISTETTDAFLFESNDPTKRIDWSLLYNVNVDSLLAEFSLAHANGLTVPTHDDMTMATDIMHNRKDTCSFCENPATYTCIGCGATRYCSAACQHKNWTTHKTLCKYYFFLTDIVSKIANGCPVPNIKLEHCG